MRSERGVATCGVDAPTRPRRTPRPGRTPGAPVAGPAVVVMMAMAVPFLPLPLVLLVPRPRGGSLKNPRERRGTAPEKGAKDGGQQLDSHQAQGSMAPWHGGWCDAPVLMPVGAQGVGQSTFVRVCGRFEQRRTTANILNLLGQRQHIPWARTVSFEVHRWTDGPIRSTSGSIGSTSGSIGSTSTSQSPDIRKLTPRSSFRGMMG